MTWHLEADALSRYAAGTVDVATAASVETHVLHCAACRDALNGYADPPALDAVWAEVVERIDAPRRSHIERLLVRLGLGDGEARLISATPTLRLSWLGALAFTFAVAVLSAGGGATDARAFLGLAPLVPVAGIATAYGRGLDPLFEITVSASYSLLRLMLLRVATVLATSAVLVGLSALALPSPSWSPLAVILPALALTMLTLLLSTVVEAPTAATLVAVGWLSTIVATRRRIPLEAITGASGQLVLGALAVGATVLLLARRNSIDLGGSS